MSKSRSFGIIYDFEMVSMVIFIHYSLHQWLDEGSWLVLMKSVQPLVWQQFRFDKNISKLAVLLWMWAVVS